MADFKQRSGGGEQEIKLTKVAGSAAAFILLVMWMTPPTTPHPIAPPTLEPFKTIRSDAPTKDPLARPGDFSGLAAPIPWSSLQVPKLRRTADEAIEGPAIEGADEPPSPPSPADIEPPAPVVTVTPPPPPPIARAESSVRPAYEQPRQAWASSDSRAFEDRADAPLEDEQ
jgi:hypothetical protein